MKSTNRKRGIQRRTFVQATAAAGGLAWLPSARSYARIAGSNERIRVAAVGFRSRGGALIDAVKREDSAELVALSDADRNVLAARESGNNDLLRTTDARELLERDDIDAIVSATPNHWHALLAILACQAGKHVYMEKPISHNMLESQAIVEAARKNDSVVQCGFQNRSDTGLIPFFDRLNSGEFGDVLSVHGTCYRQRNSIGKRETPLPIPDHIDYGLWLGPAADQPLYRPNLHYDWHWDFNTGNGDVGNQGPHEWDMMNWALGDPERLPVSMVAAGNRFGWKDAGNTPNVMACAGRTADGIPFRFEVMDLKGGGPPPHGKGVGVIVETGKGRFVGGRGGGRFETNDSKTESFSRDETQKNQDGLQAHIHNFLQAVRKRDPDLLRSECAVAGRSSSMAHMANISYQLGNQGDGNHAADDSFEQPASREMIERLQNSARQYADRNESAQPAEAWLCGARLSFDPQTQQFIDDQAAEANRLMTRRYRSGFELPSGQSGR